MIYEGKLAEFNTFTSFEAKTLDLIVAGDFSLLSPQVKICVKSRLNNLHMINIEVGSYSFKASISWLLFHALMGSSAHTEKASRGTQPAVSLSAGTS